MGKSIRTSIISVLALLCVASSVSAQEVNLYDINLTGSFHGHNINTFNAFGYTPSTIASAASLPRSNPALLSTYSSFAGGLSYQKDYFPSENWIADISLKKERQNWPQSLSLVLPFTYSNIQFSASQLYDYHMKLDMGEISTEDFPDGTGEIFSSEQLYTIHRYSIALTIPIIKIGANIATSFGLRYHTNEHQLFGRVWNNEVTTGYTSNSFSVGLLMSFYGEYLGLQYHSSVKGDGVLTYDTTTLVVPPRTVSSHIPSRFSMGFQWSLNSVSGLTSEIEYTSWSQLQYGYTDLISGAVSYYQTFKIPELVSIGLLLNPAPMSEESLEELRVNAEDGLFAIISIHQSLGYGLSIESTFGSSYGISDPWREEIFLNFSVFYGD